jgi:vanillate O-demethylase monooxygenase subunit
MSFSTDIRKTNEYIKLPMLYNHWYVAGFTEEFDQDLKAKTLLERSIVFYRSESGELTALQNRCLHRSFPLSESIKEGDDIVCGYHGIRYNTDGEIVSIPSQSMCPNRKLRKYPVQESGPLVFIWMGEAEADMSKLPDLPFLNDPDYATVKGFHELKGNYLFMQENLNDLTHFSYLHRNSFGFDDAFFDVEAEIIETDEGNWCNRVEERWELATRLLPPDAQERAKGKKVKKWEGGLTVSPGVFKGYNPAFIGEEGDEDYEVLNGYVMHYLTPETATTSHYFWTVSMDFMDQETVDATKEGIEFAFGEDLVAVENMQNLMNTDGTDFQDMNLAADKPSVLVRRKFLEWAKAEYGEEQETVPLKEV